MHVGLVYKLFFTIIIIIMAPNALVQQWFEDSEDIAETLRKEIW